MMPVIVRVRLAGASMLMIPLGVLGVLTMPGSAALIESVMAESMSGRFCRTNPKIAKARASAGKIEKKAK